MDNNESSLTIINIMMEFLTLFNDSGQRVYWLYIISTLVIVFVMFKLSPNRLISLPKLLFSKRYWLSFSAKQDYLVMVVNRFIRIVFTAPFIISMVPVAIWTSDLLENVVAAGIFSDAPSYIIVTLFTLILFLFDDFSRFLLHLASHKVKWLWQFHKVHHSALVLTPITVYRIHPIESFLYATRMALAQGCAVGLSFVLFGTRLHAADILGANVFVFVFNMMGANLRHSHIWLSWGPRFEKWFISPAQHQIHHSQDRQYHDTNFGSALAIWDRMFSCWTAAPSVKPLIRFGIKEGWHKRSAFALYWLPITENLKRFQDRRHSK